jgi:hypothetical protein
MNPPRPNPARGADRESSRTRDGMRWTQQRWRATGGRRAASAVSDRPARRRTALQHLGQNFDRPHAAGRSVWLRRLAYGEVVWSWHPLLMSS